MMHGTPFQRKGWPRHAGQTLKSFEATVRLQLLAHFAWKSHPEGHPIPAQAGTSAECCQREVLTACDSACDRCPNIPMGMDLTHVPWTLNEEDPEGIMGGVRPRPLQLLAMRLATARHISNSDQCPR
eukprot:1359284-Pyramimonas_sp.AAC.1